VVEENLSLLAAGLALYGLLAVFPGLTAAVGLCGLFASAKHASAQAEQLASVVPAPALKINNEQLQSHVSQHNSLLGAGAVAGLLIAI